MHNNNSYNNMNHFKKEYYQSKIQKMIKLCMFVKKKW